MVVPHSRLREAGTVRIDESTCKKCGQCAAICPAEKLTAENEHVRVSDDGPFGFIGCGHCMIVCPEQSVTVTGSGIFPGDLIPLPPHEAVATADALAALMQSRRSVRPFKDCEVERELLGGVVEMAASAPMGIPPWDVGCVIVRGREKVRELAAELVKGHEGFPKIFRPCVLAVMRPFMCKATHDQFRRFIVPLARHYVRAYREGRDAVFWGAPAVLIFHHSRYAEAADAAIACTHAMLAAKSLGLGNTIIGGAPPILQRNRS